jgi:hypothetical protein
LPNKKVLFSVIQATALPLVNTEGNQVKVIINYSIGDQSIVGQRINAQMGIYDRLNGTLIKLSSFPYGFILNDTTGTIQLASTLNDPKLQNLLTIIILTNEESRVQTINAPGSETGPGKVATWGRAITNEVDALGFKWEWNGRASKHIPFDWNGP